MRTIASLIATLECHVFRTRDKYIPTDIVAIWYDSVVLE